MSISRELYVLILNSIHSTFTQFPDIISELGGMISCNKTAGIIFKIHMMGQNGKWNSASKERYFDYY